MNLFDQRYVFKKGFFLFAAEDCGCGLHLKFKFGIMYDISAKSPFPTQACGSNP